MFFLSPLVGENSPTKILKLFSPHLKKFPLSKINKNSRQTPKAKKGRRRRRQIFSFFPHLEKTTLECTGFGLLAESQKEKGILFKLSPN